MRQLQHELNKEVARLQRETADLQLQFEAGTNLTAWPLVFNVGTTTASSSSQVAVEENGNAPDLITVTVPNQGAGLLFGRLKSTVTPASN